MSKTVVETLVVQERLNPSIMSALEDSTQTSLAWPFLPRNKSKGEQMALFPPAVLLRSSSFDRLRQFPAYLCSASSDLRWLIKSNTAVSQVIARYFKQLHSLFLLLSVYFAMMLLAAQVTGLVVVLATCVSIPPGLVFMVACICIISCVALKTINHDGKSAKGKVS